MTSTTDTDTGAVTHNEDWFLERLDQRPIPVAEMIHALEHLVSQGRSDQADERARLLQESLAALGDLEGAVDILHRRAGWRPSSPERVKLMLRELEELLSGDPLRRARLADAGFDRPGVSAQEAVRRARVLLALTPEMLCYDKTWKFGVVRRLDPVLRKVEIDFETRSGHVMSLAYAAEVLQRIGHDHMLARWHHDPEGIREMVVSRPAELVVLALRSFGPMTVSQVQNQIVPRILAEADWKKFWDAARKELKRDPLVEVPAKRTDPIQLRNRAEEYGARWFEQLAADRDMAVILTKVEELEESGDLAHLPEPFRQILLGRLAFVLRGAGLRRLSLGARAAMATVRLGAPLPPEADEIVRAAREPSLFIEATAALPVREVPAWLDFLGGVAGVDALAGMLVQQIGQLTYSIFEASVEWLVEHGHGAVCADAVRAEVAARRPSIEMLLWVLKDPQRIKEWNLGTTSDLAFLMLDAMEADAAGERLKAQNQLRERYGRMDWLSDVIALMTEEQRRTFMMRLRETPAWPALERQSFIGRLVKTCPVMEEHLRATANAPVESRRLAPTSLRSYRERQEQLRNIVEVEIPKNSREIEVARSYGDLRENFEYKAAKDMQALLMRRQAELVQQLRSVQPTDFRDYGSDTAGLATQVTLAYADGRRERYVLLGAWDRDEALGIISSESQMARALNGRRAGETVELPAADGTTVQARIEAVEAIPPEVRAWVQGER